MLRKQHHGPYVFTVENASEALAKILTSLRDHGKPVETRNGPALEFDAPCIITYEKPKERVIFYPERDANPFFHLMESLWMLSGSNDLKWISRFNKGMEKYSDDGKTLSGAYGYRWRNVERSYDNVVDQLPRVIHRLTFLKNDRRTVLSMWDQRIDLTMDNDRKDIPCNTHVYFSIRGGSEARLDMTVCNRSNDLIWGALGANVVHMSILQEYIASEVGVEVGIYTQFTNNLHAYTETLDKLNGMRPDYESYNVRGLKPFPLVHNTKDFMSELRLFMEKPMSKHNYSNKIFSEVAVPMNHVWEAWKMKDIFLALSESDNIKADDWRKAVREWLERRQKKDYKPNGRRSNT